MAGVGVWGSGRALCVIPTLPAGQCPGQAAPHRALHELLAAGEAQNVPAGPPLPGCLPCPQPGPVPRERDQGVPGGEGAGDTLGCPGGHRDSRGCPCACRSSSRRNVAPTTSATATSSSRAAGSPSRASPCPGDSGALPVPTRPVPPPCPPRGCLCPVGVAEPALPAQGERDPGAAVQPGRAEAAPEHQHHQRPHDPLERRGRPRGPAERHRAPQPAALLRPPGTGGTPRALCPTGARWARPGCS